MIPVATLPEMIGLYLGLDFQWYLRTELNWVPWMLIFYNTMVILGRISTQAFLENWGKLAAYWTVSLLILAAFWPEATPVGSGSTLQPQDIYSAIAEENGGTVQDAQALLAYQDRDAYTIGIPPVYEVFVRGVAELWLAAGRLAHANATRPHAGTLPLAAFVMYSPDTDTTFMIHDLASRCIKRASSRITGDAAPLPLDDLEPFPGSRLYTEMGLIRVHERWGTMRFLGGAGTILCSDLADRTLAAVAARIMADTSPSGVPLATAWQETPGIDPEDAARWIMKREIEIALGPEVPPPSLLTETVAARGVGAIARAVNPLNWLGIGNRGADVGLGEITRLTDKLSDWLGLATLIATAFPTWVGYFMATTHALFFISLLWALSRPGHQFGPLLIGLTMVAGVHALPFVFGLSELFTAWVSSAQIRIFPNPGVWSANQISVLVSQALTPLIFFTISGLLLAGARAMSRRNEGG